MITKYLLRRLYLMGGIVFLSKALCAQDPLHYWSKPEAMMQDQAALLFEQAHRILAQYPPSTAPNEARTLALIAIDALLHDARLDNGKAFLDYIQSRYRLVADKLRNEKPEGKEIRIYKLYNHGFVVQTPSMAIAIDLIRGGRADQPFVSDALIASLVDQCDILFVSHRHADHADKSVAQLFCDQNKQVIAPPDLWENMSSQIKHIRGEYAITETINIPHRQNALNVTVFPGHQDNIPNNLYAITTPERVTVMHTGDQYHDDDMEWISQVGDQIEVDVFLVHSWMPHIEKTIEGIRPKWVVVGHENEMEHTIDHRESYWLTFRRFKEVAQPYTVMAWGEYFTCHP